MKKFTNAAAASVLAGAIVLAGTPAQAAETTATETAVATTATATAAKPTKEKLTWQERQERDRVRRLFFRVGVMHARVLAYSPRCQSMRILPLAWPSSRR